MMPIFFESFADSVLSGLSVAGYHDSRDCDSGEFALFHYYNVAKYQYLYETFSQVISPIVGFNAEWRVSFFTRHLPAHCDFGDTRRGTSLTRVCLFLEKKGDSKAGVNSEHYAVWARLAALPLFRKLYGRITEDLKKGDVSDQRQRQTRGSFDRRRQLSRLWRRIESSLEELYEEGTVPKFKADLCQDTSRSFTGQVLVFEVENNWDSHAFSGPHTTVRETRALF